MSNSGGSSLSPAQYAVLQHHVEAWQQPGGERPSVYDMPADMTETLAAANIYTTTIGVANADKPLTAVQYLEQAGYRLDLAIIAHNTTQALQNVPECKEAARRDEFGHHRLGSRLAEIFGSVTAVTAHNVHVTRPRTVKGEVVDGTVAAERMVFAVPSPHQSLALHAVLQRLLRSIDGDACDVRPALDEQGNIIGVEVLDLNEHMARSLARANEALFAEEDEYLYGTALPTTSLKDGVLISNQKLTLQQLKDRGETFHPAVESRLAAADEGYKRLALQASYEGSNKMQPVTINKNSDYHLLSTDAAGMLQGMRDIFNVHIQRLRGGTHLNLEQDSNRQKRLLIDAGTDLKRNEASLEQVQGGGPLLGRRLTPREKAQQEGRKLVAKTREDPTGSSLEALEFLTDIEPIKLAFLGVKVLRSRYRARSLMDRTRAHTIQAYLHERKRLQKPDYFTTRLSWMAHIGSHLQLDEAGKQALEELRATQRE